MSTKLEDFLSVYKWYYFRKEQLKDEKGRINTILTILLLLYK